MGASSSQGLKGYSTQRKVLEIVTSEASAQSAGEREYVALYDTRCLESPQMKGRAVFGDLVRKDHQRFQAEKVTLQATELASLNSALSEDPCLIGFSPNSRMQATAQLEPLRVDTALEPLLSEQMHLDKLGAEDLWSFVYQQNSENEKIQVAVIDSGVNLSHEDLSGVLWEGAEGIGRNFLNPLASAQDNNGHGTHVAGLVAAEGTNARGGSGIAPEGVEIMALKALDDGGTGDLVTVVNAINWAVENGAEVINLSLGGPGTNTLLRATIEEAVQQGVFVVAAAGNESLEIGQLNPFSPAMFAKDIEGFMSVGSVEVDTGSISWFSNYSSTYVEVLAPGAQSPLAGLLSTVGVGDFGAYDRFFGTSMAAPLVAGTAAMIYRALNERGIQPQPAVVETLIRRYSRSKIMLGGYSVDGKTLDLRLLAQGLRQELGLMSCP